MGAIVSQRQRLKLRLTPGEAAQLAQAAETLGLRPAQVAQRLLTARLSPIPVVNRRLWQELGHTEANLTQLGLHLEAASTAHPEIEALRDEVQGALASVRRRLLGFEGAP